MENNKIGQESPCVTKLTRREKEQQLHQRWADAVEGYKADEAYFKWLGVDETTFTDAIVNLTRLEHKRDYSCTHNQEFERELDGFHADYDSPREQFEEGRWFSYKEYRKWKRENPEQPSTEMLQVKKTVMLLEECGLSYDSLMSMSPEYLKAFKHLRDNPGASIDIFQTEEELDAWSDLVGRKTLREDWRK